MFLPERDVENLNKIVYKPDNYRTDTSKTNGYIYDPTISNDKAQVYRKNGGTTIVHRGSKTAHDFFDDALIIAGLGAYTHSQKNSNRVSERSRKKYGSDNINHTGHSLGGYLAEMSAKPNEKVDTLNKHNVGLFREKKNANVLNYRNSQDLASLSLLSKRKNKTIHTHQRFTDPLTAHKQIIHKKRTITK